MIIHILLLVCICVSPGISTASQPDSTTTVVAYEKIVRAYVDAFNAHDTEAMLKMVTGDVQWLSVDGQTVTVETNSKAELRKSMNNYFSACSTCRSTIADIFTTRGRVAALEIAGSDRSPGGRRRQSLSVYEFSGTLINRVYYYPVEK